MSPWLSIVGIGEDGLGGLTPAARAAVASAEIVAGGERHLAMLDAADARPRIAWDSGFQQRLDEVLNLRGRRVCVLASGDPMWFGVGATIARRLPPRDYAVFPHPGAFSLAAARLGWALQEATTLSAHGRPVESLSLHLAPNARLLVLCEDGATPGRIARLLVERGFGPSRLVVLERLGGPRERMVEATADGLSELFHALNIVAVECRPGPQARWLPRIAGLPDEAFRHDGQLTKREIRAVTLSLLAPWPGAMLWDVGAGCGSVAVEWMRAGGTAIAIERDAARCATIAANATDLGVPGLRVEKGEAPECLRGLDGSPDAVFIGGGVSIPGMLEAAWERLPGGGCLAANALTAEGEAALLSWHARHGGEMIRLSVARLEPVGRFSGWSPLRPVTLYRGRKT